MVDYKSFWRSLEVGKWRAEATRNVFTTRVSAVFVITALYYVAAVLYYIFIRFFLRGVPSIIPGFEDIDILTPVSVLVGLFAAMLSIKFGFEGYFAQQRANPEVISFLGIIEYKNSRTLVTFINKGKAVAIRNISLLAVTKDDRRISRLLSSFWGIPSLEIVAMATVYQGWRILGEGKYAGVLERDIKRGINEIALLTKDQKDVDNLDIAIMAFDEEFDITRIESINETLLGGRLLGKHPEVAKYAKEKDGEFPGLVSGARVYFEIPKHALEKMRPGERIPLKMISEVPPSIVEMDTEIWEKVDSIEKLLSALVRRREKADTRGKSGRSAMLQTESEAIVRPGFEEVWKRIVAHAGETFHTKTGLPLTYELVGDGFYPSRTRYRISKADFEVAYQMVPIEGPGAINDIVRGPAYVWAVLHDPRISSGQW